jgi:hypothetical protein
MREATIVVTTLQEKALRDLAEFKIQVEEDFKANKKRRDEILKQLGFSVHHKPAQNKDQEALIELLLKFKKNMTPKLKKEITDKGTSETIINTIISYANTLNKENITQETLKGARKNVTQGVLKEFNEIYNEIITIAKLSAKFYKDNPAVKQKFSYSRTIKTLNPQAPKPRPENN